MPCHLDYPDTTVAFMHELNDAIYDMLDRIDDLNWFGTEDEWRDLQDHHDQLLWWFDTMSALLPGVLDCEHGLSLWLCDGAQHYPFDNTEDYRY